MDDIGFCSSCNKPIKATDLYVEVNLMFLRRDQGTLHLTHTVCAVKDGIPGVNDDNIVETLGGVLVR